MTIHTHPAQPTGVKDAASSRLARTHLPGRSGVAGVSVRDADLSLKLDGGSGDLLDTTHFDTVRFPPPEWAVGEMQKAIADGKAAYTPYRGAPEVLEALGSSIGDFLGCPVTEPNIALSPGTQGALFATLSALIDPGDLVLLADPEYLFVERMLAFLGARVERIRVLAGDDEATLDIDAIESFLGQQPRLLLFSHPSNPTGVVYSKLTIAKIAALAVRGNFRVLVDELYSRLIYDDATFPHLRAEPGMGERSITLLGPSKTESMSGFRLGVVVAAPDVIAAIEQCVAMTSLRAPAYGQQLLTRWLVDDEEFLAERVADLAALRQLTVDRLGTVPALTFRVQSGTAYLWVDVSAFGMTDVEVAGRLQREAGVIVSPGYQFGPSGVGHFRICYARDEAQWAAALDRMVESLRRMAPAVQTSR